MTGWKELGNKYNRVFEFTFEVGCFKFLIQRRDID